MGLEAAQSRSSTNDLRFKILSFCLRLLGLLPRRTFRILDLCKDANGIALPDEFLLFFVEQSKASEKILGCKRYLMSSLQPQMPS